ncbi:hypothetical protein CASFOL_017261 [Castilleja foliolosa]|uniref:Plant thionin family protein n=1 Tax=Castilleja foliolosa TaxID=1961234 RepID=A0ABD3DE50_9LAMI
MANTRLNLMIAIVVALVVAPVAQAAERNVDLHCMTECYFECNQIKIFSERECKKDCVNACARLFMTKADEEDDTKFVPLWI